MLTGTMEEEVLGRTFSTQTGTWSTELMALSLTGMVLYAPELPGHDHELWVHEVVGAEVVDAHGHALGTVAAVEANPAHDLLVLEDGALIPVTFVVEHAADERGAGRVVVDIPDGLLDL